MAIPIQGKAESNEMLMFRAYRLSDVPMLMGIGMAFFLIAYSTNSYFLSIGIRIPVVRCSVGFGLGILILTGARYWPAIFVGAFLNRLLIGFSIFSSLSNALGVSMGCAVGCWLLKRDKKFDPAIPSLNDYFRLLLWACAIGAGFTSVIAAISMLGGEVVRQPSAGLILKWWMADTLGIVLITPLVLVWRHPPRFWLEIRRLVEVLTFFSLSFLVGQTVFLNWFHESLGSIARGYWLFLFVVWGAARLGPQSVVLVLVMAMLQALTGAARGVGFFATDIAQTQLLNFWFYMAILAIVGMGLASAVTAFIQAELTVRNLALHDALTGLANRRMLAELLHQALTLAKRQGYSMALIFHDLDNFKPVNDRFGHKAGDLLLQAVARRVQECVRESDTVARLGGDEFVILLPSIEEKNDVLLVAEKIHHALLRPFVIDGHTINISTSMGIAIYPDHSDSEESLLADADNAMYFAKTNGRNNIQFFSAGMAVTRQGAER